MMDWAHRMNVQTATGASGMIKDAGLGDDGAGPRDESASGGRRPPGATMTAPGGVRILPALAALAATIALLMIAIAGSALTVGMVIQSGGAITAVGLNTIALVVLQIVAIIMTLVLARARGPLSRSLNLVWPDRSGLGELPKIVLVMTAILGVYTLAVFWLAPDLIKKDLAAFRPMVASDYWPLAVAVVVIGAPVSEELLFRGYLMRALGDSGVGFIVAAVTATAIWTGLHYGYSIVGLTEVFMAGLLLSWALYRTGSVLVAILLHATYNAAALGVMVMVLS